MNMAPSHHLRASKAIWSSPWMTWTVAEFERP